MNDARSPRNLLGSEAAALGLWLKENVDSHSFYSMGLFDTLEGAALKVLVGPKVIVEWNDVDLEVPVTTVGWNRERIMRDPRGGEVYSVEAQDEELSVTGYMLSTSWAYQVTGKQCLSLGRGFAHREAISLLDERNDADANAAARASNIHLPGLRTDGRLLSIDERFDEWMEGDGQKVYDNIRNRAFGLVQRGWTHYSIRALWEAARYDFSLTLGPEGGLKMNDHFHSRMSRRLMADYPDILEGFFETRALKA